MYVPLPQRLNPDKRLTAGNQPHSDRRNPAQQPEPAKKPITARRVPQAVIHRATVGGEALNNQQVNRGTQKSEPRV